MLLARAVKAVRPAGPTAWNWLQAVPELRGLVWLVGPEDYLREQLLRKIRLSTLEVGFEDFNHQVLSLGSQTRWATLVDALSEIPQMAERRLLELHQVEDLSSKVADQLAQLLSQEKLHPGLVVVLVSGTRKLRPALLEVLEHRAQAVACDIETAQRSDFVAWSCQQCGLTLTTQQIQVLVERTGGSLRALASWVERLRLYAGSAGSLSDREVDSLVEDSSEVQVWKLTEALGRRQMGRSYELLHRILRQEPAQTLLSYLNTYVVGLIRVAELKGRLKTAAAIAKELPPRSEFQIRKSLEELASWSEAELELTLQRMARADYRIKTGTEPILMLQLLILQICSRKGPPR